MSTAIYVTGDTHGANQIGYAPIDGFMPRFNTRNFPEQKELCKGDYIVICGDFGGVWEPCIASFGETPAERYALDWLEDKPFTTLFVPGNHENYDRLTGIEDEELLNSWLFEKLSTDEKNAFRKGYPRKEWHGGAVREVRPSVLMLEPGVFDLGGRKCFAYGGALSHDIQDGILNPCDFASKKSYRIKYDRMCKAGASFRVKGVSWWAQEQPDERAEEMALSALEGADWRVDFVFTHDCAVSDRCILGHPSGTARINQFLEEVKTRTKYKHWFFGHLHGNENLPGGKEHLIYEQVVRID